MATRSQTSRAAGARVGQLSDSPLDGVVTLIRTGLPGEEKEEALGLAQDLLARVARFRDLFQSQAAIAEFLSRALARTSLHHRRDPMDLRRPPARVLSAASARQAAFLAAPPRKENRRAELEAAVLAELEAVFSAGSVADIEPANPPSLEVQIDQLYDELIALSRDQSREGTDVREKEIERKFARLRDLQEAEAARHRAAFEASLEMPIDAGRQILARAEALRTQLENLAAADTSSD